MATKKSYYKSFNTYQCLVRLRDRARAEGETEIAEGWDKWLERLEKEMIKEPKNFTYEQDPQRKEELQKQKIFKKEGRIWLNRQKSALVKYE